MGLEIKRQANISILYPLSKKIKNKYRTDVHHYSLNILFLSKS